jgi:hypothetical protein
MKSNILRGVLLAALACGVPAAAMAGDLKMSIQNGRVTIMADNVPLRQILQEWARLGQTKILNADKLNGPAVTLQLVDTPEKDALDILLRSASGYIAAPRPVAVADASMYDRITIMATSRPPAAVTSAAPPPTFQRPPQPLDEEEPINVAPNPGPNPVVGAYPGMQPGALPPGVQPQPVIPGAQPQPAQGYGAQPPGAQQPVLQSQPGMPVQQPQTAPRPGMLPPPTPTPGFPNPYQPPQVVRPGGGGGGGGGL